MNMDKFYINKVLVILLQIGFICNDDHGDHSYDDHSPGQVIKTEVHEYNSRPMTQKKLEFNPPEVVIYPTNDGHSDNENELTIDFTGEKKSYDHSYDSHDRHERHTSNYYHRYHPHHRYSYNYHYVPKRRKPTPKEIEIYNRDRIAFFRAFAQSFLVIGMRRSERITQPKLPLVKGNSTRA